LFAGEAWFDPLEAGLRERIRGFIEELVEQELEAALGRGRYERGGTPGHRHGHRERRLTGSFGRVQIAVPRARPQAEDGTTREWRSAVLPRYARMTRQVEALIAGAYLSGTNTRRVGRALGALFRGAVGKDVVGRTWRKAKVDWEAWCRRDLAGETSSAWSWTAPWSGPGSTGRRPPSPCSWSSASAGTARRCCWPRAAWAGRARPPGAPCSTTSSRVGCGRRRS
jgi:hypothetical protein